MAANFAPEAEVNKFMKRVFILPTFRGCREHGDHHELTIVVPAGKAQSIVYRIAENNKKYYLSKKLLDLRTQILPSRPSPTDGSRRPMWLGEIDDDPVIRETLAEKLEEALRTIEDADADAACSREWALKFIEWALKHLNELDWCGGRLQQLKITLLLQSYSAE
ncbi:uncharacterized protein PGTG_19693 [Puccinia graminis f. sp. tritici CRL 75-36-700-3]|uniref:Uncharacterized protein n=1 Tax=Puccinia graminis f. sp. tritici (strain CRL 75-36-700-3 / race SCCL) TaxID=418459 RepID=E3LAZ9_PUCGT|nr:uncharacterized protein PGTG_19693 [Puccinia graminis f. sp. tritici CRL 75-36-700-3]EFP93724.2 hypothetical protein PGTG_19693 [Puccinia graminis f. sp. tritici CRL 75-36-700-3]